MPLVGSFYIIERERYLFVYFPAGFLFLRRSIFAPIYQIHVIQAGIPLII